MPGRNSFVSRRAKPSRVPYDWYKAEPSCEVREVVGKSRAARPVWEQNGIVYTKPWVVEFILDLAGYVPSENLVDSLALEPCSGSGEFIETMVRRLVGSCKRQGRDIKDCELSLQAFDMDPVSVEQSRERAVACKVHLCRLGGRTQGYRGSAQTYGVLQRH